MKNKTVYVVHNIDTEGPLYESLRANFERIYEMFGHEIEPSMENLKKLQNAEIDLAGDEEAVRNVLTTRRIGTHDSWTRIDEMLDEITSTEYRNLMKDSSGNGWIYNWLCMTHVGFTGINPRRRDVGYHNVFDHYREYFDKRNDNRDLVQWHYHALSLTNDAHRAGSTYLNSDHIYNILSRSIIDRSWFPAVFRAGHNTERPDSHFFLEQWIPFDFSNASSGFIASDKQSSHARYGDWRTAPTSWLPYHPSHDDYRLEGSCRRYIARCLSIDDREYSITGDDVDTAFAEADMKGTAILSFTHHDFRDMRPDIERMRQFISNSSQKYPGIDFIYSTAINAMRHVFKMEPIREIGFSVELKKHKSQTQLIIESSNEIFGPQPYLALKTRDDRYVWQNTDFEGNKRWSYTFDMDNILIDQIAEIGIASNTASGLTEVVNLNPHSGKQKKTVLNP